MIAQLARPSGSSGEYKCSSSNRQRTEYYLPTSVSGGGDIFANITTLPTRTDLSQSTEVQARLLALRGIAAEEGSAYSQLSEADLKTFVDQFGTRIVPKIFLLENGDLRAVWRNADGEQVALHFKGRSVVQFVFFVKRLGDEARFAGRDTLDGIRAQIGANALARLLR